MFDLLVISLFIILAFGLATFGNRYGIPRISTYVLLGVLCSKDLLGNALNIPTFEYGEIVTKIALGVVGFLIGAELEWKKGGSLSRTIVWGTIGQVFGAIVVVFIGLQGFKYFGNIEIGLAPIILLSAIAATTDPAGILGVIDQYKASGSLTKILLGIVILDDALGIVAFHLMVIPFKSGGVLTGLLPTVTELGGAVVLGSLLGIILGFISRIFSEEELRFPIFVAFILLCSSLSATVGFSPILSCMFLGVVTQVVSNQEAKRLILPIKHIEEFIFIIFFLLAGLHFELAVFKKGMPLLILYILLRALGKYLGAWIGGAVGGCSPKVRGLMGLGLLPQAGVALGLALSITQTENLAQYAPVVINVVLGSMIVFEIVGPILTKVALVAAGEVKEIK